MRFDFQPGLYHCRNLEFEALEKKRKKKWEGKKSTDTHAVPFPKSLVAIDRSGIARSPLDSKQKVSKHRREDSNGLRA